MSDELIEQLTKRLRLVGEAADHTDDFKWNCWRALPALAAECIRQMEYARRCVYLVPGGPPEVLAAYPLALAPEDWEP